MKKFKKGLNKLFGSCVSVPSLDLDANQQAVSDKKSSTKVTINSSGGTKSNKSINTIELSESITFSGSIGSLISEEISSVKIFRLIEDDSSDPFIQLNSVIECIANKIISKGNITSEKAFNVQCLLVSLISSFAFQYDNNILTSNKLKELSYGACLGQGQYGTVSLVLDQSLNELYALKTISMSMIFAKGIKARDYCIKSILNERNCLRYCIENKFTTKLLGSYSDKINFYFLFNAGVCGTFHSLINNRGQSMTELDMRFYIGCVINAVYEMHSNDIVHRDLKPSNLLLSENGYLKLTDFGFAKQLKGNNRTNTLCGSVGYLAPEIICSKSNGYGKVVDFFSIGCLLYKLMFGHTIFKCFNEILMAVCQFDRLKNPNADIIRIPSGYSPECNDFLRGLLKFNGTKRLGYDVDRIPMDIMNHDWFVTYKKQFNWCHLYTQQLPPPKRFPVIQPLNRGCFQEKQSSDINNEDPVSVPKAHTDWINYF